jgi:hypothetical protein
VDCRAGPLANGETTAMNGPPPSAAVRGHPPARDSWLFILAEALLHLYRFGMENSRPHPEDPRSRRNIIGGDV